MSQYDFIMNPGKPPRRSLLPSGNSMVGRIVVIAGLGVVLIIAIIIVMSLFSGSGNMPKLVTVAQKQQELIRISTLATTTGLGQSSQTTKNFTESCLLSLTSAQQQLLNFTSTHGKKISQKELALGKNTATDATLKSAIQATNFDSTYTNIMQTQLATYANSLKSAFSTAKNVNEKQLLSNDYSGAQLLLKQLTTPAP